MQTKELILKILLENKNCSISGEKIASQCKISRTAVWKAIKNLREEGYEIEGVQNGGYILKNAQEVFSEQNFKFNFYKEFPQFSESKIDFFTQIDSTNSYAKRLLSEAGTLYDLNGNISESGKNLRNRIIFAESQTNGRGRFGRTFVSPQKTGLYISIIHAPKEGILNPGKITAFTAVAVKRAIKNVFSVEPKIKWINDLYLNEKKICGILTEGTVNFELNKIEACVIGIGINIFQNENFSDDLKNIAGGIISSKENLNFYRMQLLVQICGEVLKIFNENEKNLIQEYKASSFLIGREVKVFPIIGEDKTSYLAKVLDIDENAHLVIEDQNGIKKALESGEVSIKF